MPSLKRNVSAAPERSGFEPYEGPTPRPGFYRGVITAAKVRVAKTERLGFAVTVVLKALEGSESVKYDGYPAFVNIWLGDEEALQTREKAFYMAVSGKDDVAVVYNDLKADKEAGKITKIAGKNIIGTEVMVELRNDTYEGEQRIQADSIIKVKSQIGTKTSKVAEPVEDDDDDLIEDEDEVEEDTAEIDERRDELTAMSAPALRLIAKPLSVAISGVKKADLIEAILDAEFAADAEDEPEEDDEDVEDDDLEDAEDDEEEEDDEDDEDPEEALRAELADLDRVALKKHISDLEDGAKFKKSETDDDLRDRVVALEIEDDEPAF